MQGIQHADDAGDVEEQGKEVEELVEVDENQVKAEEDTGNEVPYGSPSRPSRPTTGVAMAITLRAMPPSRKQRRRRRRRAAPGTGLQSS